MEKCHNSVEHILELRRTVLFKIHVLELYRRLAVLFASKNRRGFEIADITPSKNNSLVCCVIDGGDPQIKCSEI